MMICCIPGVEVTYKNQVYPVLINPTNVSELTSIQVTAAGVVVGASVTLTTLEEVLREQVSSRPGMWLSLPLHPHHTALHECSITVFVFACAFFLDAKNYFVTSFIPREGLVLRSDRFLECNNGWRRFFRDIPVICKYCNPFLFVKKLLCFKRRVKLCL